MSLKIIISGILLSSSFAFAQSNGVKQRLLDTSRRVNDQIYRELDYMNGETARVVTEKLLDIERTINAGTRPDPYPGNPNPPPPHNPPPPPPPSNGAYYVSFVAEGTSFSVNISDTSQAFDACMAKFANLSKADDISVSINYGQKKSRTTGGYWYGAGSLCAQAVNMLAELNLPQARYGIHIGGTVQGHSFSFKGNGFGELASRCESFVRERAISKSDSVVTTNMRIVKNLTTGGYWYTPVEICQQVLSVL